MINCEIEIDLSCSRERIISEISTIPTASGNPDTNPLVPEVAAIQKTSLIFPMNNVELSIPVALFY